jgi:thiol-disulfide isomerase/thioredoxin
MITLLLALALPALAAEPPQPSLLKNRPVTALADEVIELKPVDGHHFNVEAPQKCGKDRPLEVVPRRVRCQMTRTGKTAVMVSVCDDALTFCRQESFDVLVTGVSRSTAKKSPMAAPPKESRHAPQGFLDNVPDEAVARAKKEKKLLFIDFYGIWCPPCNDLEEHSYPTAEFRAASKDLVKLAMDADAASSFDWKTRFKVGGYPTLIIADAQLREIGRVVGFKSGVGLVQFINEANAHRDEPVEAAAELVAKGGGGANALRRMRVAQWLSDRGEFEKVETLLKDLPIPQARKILLAARRERARLQDDAAAGLAALKELIKSFPDDPDYSDWASTLADVDPAAARAIEGDLRKSVDRWSSDNSLGATGYDTGDLFANLASFLDAIGSTEAAKAVWSKTADAYAAQAKFSPLAVARAANFGRGEALMKAGRNPEAKKLYESLVKAYPKEFTFNYDYATQLSDLEPAAAYPYAVTAVQSAYGDNWLRAVRLKASLELKLGKPDDAAKTLDEALAQAAPPKSAAVRTYRYITALRELRAKVAAASAKKT